MVYVMFNFRIFDYFLVNFYFYVQIGIVIIYELILYVCVFGDVVLGILGCVGLEIFDFVGQVLLIFKINEENSC